MGTYHIIICTISMKRLNKQVNQFANGFLSSPKLFRIIPNSIERTRTPKRFAELYFSWPAYSEITFFSSITWTESADTLHGFITSLFKNDDRFLADDLTKIEDLFTNVKFVAFFSNFVPVYK